MASTSKCYAKLNNNIVAQAWTPCGPTNSSTPVVPCCADGDFCLTNGICHYTHPLTGGSGYYAGGCTDSAFTDAKCPQLCNDRAVRYVVYNTTSKIWNCCGANTNGGPNCDAPTTETFSAPAEANLKTYFTISSSTSSSSGSQITKTTGTSTATRASATAGKTAAAKSSELSPGAAGGIGAAVAVAVIALCAVIGFFIWRRRKVGRRTKGYHKGEAIPYKGNDASMDEAAKSALLDGPQELAGNVPGEALVQAPVELAADEAPSRSRPTTAVTSPGTLAPSLPSTSPPVAPTPSERAPVRSNTTTPARSNAITPTNRSNELHLQSPAQVGPDLPESLRIHTPSPGAT